MNNIKKKDIKKELKKFRKSPHFTTLIVLCMLGIIGTIAQNYANNFNADSNTMIDHIFEVPEMTELLQNNIESTFSFSADNEYTLVYGPPGQDLPWLEDQIVEPYKKTFLSPVGLKEDELKGHKFQWYIDDIEELWGQSISYIFKVPDKKYLITLNMYDPDDLNTPLKTTESYVYNKYVRREIRTLSDGDREIFMSALNELYTVNLQDGQIKYGEKYRDIEYFAGEHLLQAGQIECDHMHDGLGFLTQHAALTAQFERALQVVEPSVTIPYWDYSIDFQECVDKYDSDFSCFYDSIVFDEDWFGGIDDDSHSIKGSRWSDYQLPDTIIEDSPKNGYGILRAPWNQNSDRTISRSKYLCGLESVNALTQPSCEVHYDAVVNHNTWDDFGWFISYDPHGPVHVDLGGNWGCEDTFDDLDEYFTQKEIDHLKASSYNSQKNLWRAGFLTCPEDCSTDDDCQCYCTNLKKDIKNGDIDDYLEYAFISAPPSFIENASHKERVAVVEAICDMEMIEGDHLEAASPIDPLFWPMHPTIERLWQWKKLKGTFTDESWPTTNVAKSGQYYVDCEGHHEYDEIVFQGIFATDYEFTNRDVYDYFDPTSDNLPFIFDNYEWNHCADVGYDFRE